jgi:hypothetical protein
MPKGKIVNARERTITLFAVISFLVSWAANPNTCSAQGYCYQVPSIRSKATDYCPILTTAATAWRYRGQAAIASCTLHQGHVNMDTDMNINLGTHTSATN